MKEPRLTCSAACGYQFRKLRARKQKTCPICCRRFWPLKRRLGIWATYCSNACYRVKQNERLAMVQVTCEHCARTFRRTAGAVKRAAHLFCNRVCASKFMSGEQHANWRGGHEPNRGPVWLRLAASMRKRDGYRCRRCGRTQAENGASLEVDHIKPWRSFENKAEANDPSNLASLCKTCHRHKTGSIERKWLRGDVLAMQQYEDAIKLTS